MWACLLARTMRRDAGRTCAYALVHQQAVQCTEGMRQKMPLCARHVEAMLALLGAATGSAQAEGQVPVQTTAVWLVALFSLLSGAVQVHVQIMKRNAI